MSAMIVSCVSMTGGRRSARVASRSNERADAGDRLADDQVLHLIGALVGVERLDVVEEARDIVVGDDAIAAQELASPGDRFARLGGAERLCERRMVIAELAFVVELRKAKHHALAGRQ